MLPSRQIDLLVIAGEHSGDAHAALGVRALKSLHPNLNICAIGGQALRQAGAHLLFDITQWSVVGLVESLRHYRQFVALMNWIVHWVEAYQPREICLVDFPGFNLRLAKQLFDKKLTRKAGGKIPLCAYIAPQIWAWKSGRRFAMAKYFDRLAVLFAFEKECFDDTSLDVQYVGNPLIHENLPFEYDESGELLLLPGSRMVAVQRICPLLLDAFGLLSLKRSNLRGLILYPDESIKRFLEKLVEEKQLRQSIRMCHHSNLTAALKVSGALMSSGTASLKVALAGIPGVVVYRAHYLTYLLGKMLIKVPYLSMANILLQRPAYPEILKPSSMQAFYASEKMQTFLQDPKAARQQFKKHADDLYNILSSPVDNSLEEFLLQDL